MCGYKNIWGHGQVWNGGRSSGQTTEPSQEERDRNPAFSLFRFSRYSKGFFLLFFLQQCHKAGGRETRDTVGYNGPNMIYHEM